MKKRKKLAIVFLTLAVLLQTLGAIPTSAESEETGPSAAICPAQAECIAEQPEPAAAELASASAKPDANPESLTAQTGTDEPSGSEVPCTVQTLTIQRHTGLPGSDTYETAAAFTYEELKDRSFWEYDYSYIDPAKGVIIDHAQGIALRELLIDAGIDLDSAAELVFLSDEAQLTLPAADLLNTTRYCHFSLPDHYDDGSYLTDPMAALFCQKVETILAVQDHWMPVSEGGMFWSDPAGMTADNAFRLVFGQADITESKAAASLSHIHTIRVLTDANLTDPPEESEESSSEPGPGDAPGETTELDQDSPVSGELPEQNRNLPDDEGATTDQTIQASGPAPSIPDSRALTRTTYPSLPATPVTDGRSDDQDCRESENDNQATSEQKSLSRSENSSLSPENGSWQTAASPPASRNSERQNDSAGSSSSAAATGPAASVGRLETPHIQEVLLNGPGTPLDPPADSTQPSTPQDQPAGIGGDSFRIYEMAPVSPEGKLSDQGFAFEEETLDTRQVLWLFLAVFLLPAAVRLIYYLKRYLVDKREHQDEQKEGKLF